MPRRQVLPACAKRSAGWAVAEAASEWVKIMEEEIIPFQVSKGMVICGSFRGETDASAYIWIRRFNSEAEREAQYKAVYETDHWKTKIAPRVPDCLDREKMHIQRVVPTSRSTMQ